MTPNFQCPLNYSAFREGSDPLDTDLLSYASVPLHEQETLSMRDMLGRLSSNCAPETTEHEPMDILKRRRQ
jgi:hypothetical protein